MNKFPFHALIAVGSRSDQICSVGAFARAEAKALDPLFEKITILEPDQNNHYPNCNNLTKSHLIFYHTPSLHDRMYPWRFFSNAIRLRKTFPDALFLPIVHEFSEAPYHWKMRQLALLEISHGAIVNSLADFEGIKKWKSLFIHRGFKILHTHLGPTLFFENLSLNSSTDTLHQTIQKTRETLARQYSLNTNKKWLLHAGLVTQGKGIKSLKRLATSLGNNIQLILMGGIGPKEKDQDFAKENIEILKQSFQDDFHFIFSPKDSEFRDFLLAADLIILPYEIGLSERRSSFLSAMYCAANIWTTTGQYSNVLELEKTGVHFVETKKWHSANKQALDSVGQALEEESPHVISRRLKNLSWATNRSWDHRMSQMRSFLESLGLVQNGSEKSKLA